MPPTWQTMAGGSPASSRYIVYSDVPGGVRRIQGSALVPLPCAIVEILSVVTRVVPSAHPATGGRPEQDPRLDSCMTMHGLV